MKSFIVLALFVAAALAAPAAPAAPANPDADAVILEQSSDNDGLGGYRSVVETSNGIVQKEVGVLKNPGAENEAIEVRGEFSYLGPDGKIYSVSYVGNENGFNAIGEHIPQ